MRKESSKVGIHNAVEAHFSRRIQNKTLLVGTLEISTDAKDGIFMGSLKVMCESSTLMYCKLDFRSRVRG